MRSNEEEHWKQLMSRGVGVGVEAAADSFVKPEHPTLAVSSPSESLLGWFDPGCFLFFMQTKRRIKPINTTSPRLHTTAIITELFPPKQGKISENVNFRIRV